MFEITCTKINVNQTLYIHNYAYINRFTSRYLHLQTGKGKITCLYKVSIANMIRTLQIKTLHKVKLKNNGAHFDIKSNTENYQFTHGS